MTTTTRAGAAPVARRARHHVAASVTAVVFLAAGYSTAALYDGATLDAVRLAVFVGSLIAIATIAATLAVVMFGDVPASSKVAELRDAVRPALRGWLVAVIVTGLTAAAAFAL